MSINTSHRAGVNGVVLFYGERLLIFYDGCEFKLGPPLKGNHKGRLYLTSHRVIFVNNQQSAGLQSFSMPFIFMREVDIKQPVFGPNRVVGKIKAESNGGWQGEANFDLVFNRGGAIEFGQALVELGRRACEMRKQFRPPPAYTPTYDPNGAAQYYACPPPAYMPPYHDPYYGFVGQHEAFSVPTGETVYHNGMPPPYAGAATTTGTGWGSPPPGAAPGQPPYPMPTSSAPPPAYASAQPTSQANNNVSETHYQSAAHAAKAAEASAQQPYPNGPGYYFRENPHVVYAEPSAPPPNDVSSGAAAATPGDLPPPSYSSATADPRTKKTQ